MTHEAPELQRLQGQERDREITLSMGTILGIFFALALVCAVFFGMGYTLGRHSAMPQASTDGAPADSNFNGFKPSPQSVAIQPAPGYSPAQAAAANSGTDSSSTVTPPAASSNSAPAAITTTTATTTATMPVSTKPAAVTAPAPVIAPVQQNLIVQVAAVSHQEDADILLSALRKQGYTVTARQVPEDKLIHIQIGPFNNRKDADAMRQKLLSDGYSAIVK
jgi:cell division septation protein DedD